MQETVNLSDEQKLEILSCALITISENKYRYICDAIHNYVFFKKNNLKIKTQFSIYNDMETIMPELFKRKPKKPYSEAAWFEPYEIGREKRISVLQDTMYEIENRGL